MTIRFLISLLVASTVSTAHGDLVLFYQGAAYDAPTEGNFTASDFICGVFTFPMPLPTTDGTLISPTSATLQTSENGAAGFFSSTRDTGVNLPLQMQPFTWDATSNIPVTWNYAVETGVDDLTITSAAFDGDTAFVGGSSNISLIAGTWSSTIPVACNTPAHSAISAVPEPSAFLFLGLVGSFAAGRLYFRTRRVSPQQAVGRALLGADSSH